MDRDRRAHGDFLDRSHALADEQKTSYTALTVDLLDADLHDDGPSGPPMAGGGLRTAHCRVRPGRFHQALEAQERHERVAELRRRADATTDFSSVTGDLVELRTS